MQRNLRKGWTMDQRRSYIEFINTAAKHPGGNSFGRFLANMRDEVLSYLSNADRTALADISRKNFNPVPDFPSSLQPAPAKTEASPPPASSPPAASSAKPVSNAVAAPFTLLPTIASTVSEARNSATSSRI
ncbi:MAG: hypothetical protein AAGH89_16525 [Verrucomicrobiota bacterium]